MTTEKEREISDIKQQLKRYLPEYMIPKTIVFLEKIPVNQNGKYDRKKSLVWYYNQRGLIVICFARQRAFNN